MTHVYLAYNADLLWGIFATREAAQQSLEAHLAEYFPAARIVEDWANVNVPEAQPSWRRYYDAPHHNWQRIDRHPVRDA